MRFHLEKTGTDADQKGLEPGAWGLGRVGKCLAGLSGFPSEVCMAPTLEIGVQAGAAEPRLVISDHSTAETPRD